MVAHWPYQIANKLKYVHIRLDTIPQRDGQTDRQRNAISISRVSDNKKLL